MKKQYYVKQIIIDNILNELYNKSKIIQKNIKGGALPMGT